MLGLKFKVEAIYFASFRKPATTAIVLSYPIPPFTTIRGLIANALGLPRDFFEIQEWFKIGIRPIKIEKNIEVLKLLKFISRKSKFKCLDCGNVFESDKKQCPKCKSKNLEQLPIYERTFPSSPVYREFLINPSYWIYIVGEDDKIKMIYDALKNPKRPLYLGTSDDLVDLEIFEPINVKKINSYEINSVLDGIHENCVVESVPYKFIQVTDKRGNIKDVQLEYRIVSIPVRYPYIAERPLEVWNFGDEFVRVI